MTDKHPTSDTPGQSTTAAPWDPFAAMRQRQAERAERGRRLFTRDTPDSTPDKETDQ